jgi:thioesterase domain-containing protein/acyl carrier protein
MMDKRLELLADLLAEEGIHPQTVPTIPCRKNLAEYPLSFNQQRLWLLNLLENGIHYNDHFDLRLSGRLDVSALERAIEEIYRRHEAMRSVFSEIDGGPFQTITRPQPVALPLIDLTRIPESRRISEATRGAIEEARKPFNLSEGPLWRFSLVRITEDDHLLLITAHHIAIDGWSRGVFLRELAVLYPSFLAGQPSPLKELAVQYADYAAWQLEWVHGATVARQIDYWKHELAGAPAFLALPTDRARPALPSFRGARHWFTLSSATTAALKGLCQRERVSLFMTLLAVLQTVLYGYTGHEDFLVWTPVANRTRKELEGMIGYFLNMLVLRGRVSNDDSFRELLRRARATTLGALANQDVPLEKLIEVLQPERVQGYPLFQVLFVHHNVPMPDVEMAGIRVSEFEIDSGAANFELTISLTETHDGIRGRIEYATDLFDPERIVRMANHFQIVIDAVCAKPEAKLSQLPVPAESNHMRAHALSRPRVEAASEPVPPRDMLEQHLVKIWENVLHVRRVGLDDNFFDLGGHSLGAVRLFSEIRKQMGRNLPLATLLQAPTVRQLAEILRKAGWLPRWSSLVPIQPGGSRPPFYCVHGGGGNVLLFRELASCLGPAHPFFGLQSQGLDGKGDYLTTVSAMAQHYLKEIRGLQPEGPYLLGGFCMGGAVAYHMAQLLLEQGQETSLLVFFDTYNHNGVSPSVSVAARLGRAKEMAYFHWANMSQLRLPERITYLRGKLKGVKGRQMEKLRSTAFLEDINDRAGFSYQPKPYPGKVTIFQPQTRTPHMGWKGFVLGGVELIELPVYPGGMFVEPYVRILADKLRACIDTSVRARGVPA